MTYRPIPEERRRELATFIPDLAEERRRTPCIGHTAERDFWSVRLIVMTRRDACFPTNAAERLWLIRHAHLAVTGADPLQVPGFQWPGFCVRTGRNATAECWPLEPIPGAKAPPTEPPKETPGPKRADECSVVIEGRVVKPGDVLYYKPCPLYPGFDGQARTVSRTVDTDEVWFTNGRWTRASDMTFAAPIDHQAWGAAYAAQAFDFSKGLTDSDVKRTSLQEFSDYMNRRMLELVMPQIIVNPAAAQQSHPQIQAAPTPSNLENTMNQATAFNADSLTVDTSNIVETKTFVFGRDITTLDDNDLLGNIQLLDQKIDKLEAINAKTPLVKLVTKIAQLKDAKAKIVELLGGAPVEQASPAIDADETKPKRVRRTKAELEADNAELKAAPIPLTPPTSKVDSDPSADVDIDYNA